MRLRCNFSHSLSISLTRSFASQTVSLLAVFPLLWTFEKFIPYIFSVIFLFQSLAFLHTFIHTVSRSVVQCSVYYSEPFSFIYSFTWLACLIVCIRVRSLSFFNLTTYLCVCVCTIRIWYEMKLILVYNSICLHTLTKR